MDIFFSIWNHLSKLVGCPKSEEAAGGLFQNFANNLQEPRLVRRKQRTTILITTHYIEEARQASVVGLMRHGRLLAEDNPIRLMNAYNLTSMEEVFLKLCIKQQEQVRVQIILRNINCPTKSSVGHNSMFYCVYFILDFQCTGNIALKRTTILLKV